MTVARPTRIERNAAAKARKSVHKRKCGKKAPWTFSRAQKECEAAGFKLHTNAQTTWNQQTAVQSVRKMLMQDGRAICMNSIMSGATRAVLLTEEQKTVVNARLSVTLKQREHKQRHWLERASFEEAMRILDEHKRFEFATVPDGLGADFIVRRKGTELWAAIQVKSSVAHPDEKLQFSHLNSTDGDKGGKYEHLVILAVGVAPGCVPPDSSSVFDAVANVEVKELFVYNRASDMPNKTLLPQPRRKAADLYGDHRYVVGFDTPERLDIMRTFFRQCIDANSVFTKADAWYGSKLNPTVSEQRKEEVLNCKALGDLLGHERLRAPNAQGETVDVVLELDDRDVKISLKTATQNKKGFQFELGKAVNSHFCDIVLAFYNDRKSQERTHVSVITCKRAYVKGVKNFCWSLTNKNNKDVMHNRIDLRTADAAKKLVQALA
jgi:hypothetical protein